MSNQTESQFWIDMSLLTPTPGVSLDLYYEWYVYQDWIDFKLSTQDFPSAQHQGLRAKYHGELIQHPQKWKLSLVPNVHGMFVYHIPKSKAESIEVFIEQEFDHWNIGLESHNIMEKLWSMTVRGELIWKTNISLSPEFNHYSIAVPGRHRSSELHLPNSSHSNNTVTVYWIPDLFREYLGSFLIFSRKTRWIYHVCRFQVIQGSVYFYWKEMQQNPRKFPGKYSWQSAKQKCHKNDRNLPEFANMVELHNFLTVIQFSIRSSPIEAVFVDIMIFALQRIPSCCLSSQQMPPLTLQFWQNYFYVNSISYTNQFF